MLYDKEKTVCHLEPRKNSSNNSSCNKMSTDMNKSNKVFAVNFTSIDNKMSQLHTWHRRLAHSPISVIQHIKCLEISNDLSKEHKNKLQVCEACHKAKQTRFPFPSRTCDASKIFELIHVDIWGPYSAPSLTKSSYMLTIVDDHSRATWTYLLQHNS